MLEHGTVCLLCVCVAAGGGRTGGARCGCDVPCNVWFVDSLRTGGSMSKVKLRPITMMLLAALVIGSGCNNEDARVAEVAVEAAKRQAQQNQEMAHLNREVAEGTKRLVEGQAETDQRFQSMQQDNHVQRDQLETESPPAG